MPRNNQTKETRFTEDGYVWGEYAHRAPEDRPGADPLKGKRPTQDLTTDFARAQAGGGYVAPEFRPQDELDEEERLRDRTKQFIPIEEIPALEDAAEKTEDEEVLTAVERMEDLREATWEDEVNRQVLRHEEKKAGWRPVKKGRPEAYSSDRPWDSKYSVLEDYGLPNKPLQAEEELGATSVSEEPISAWEEKLDRAPVEPKESIQTVPGSIGNPKLDRIYVYHDRSILGERQYKGGQAHNLRHKGARGARLSEETAAAVTAGQKELPKRKSRKKTIEVKSVIVTETKPNPEDEMERQKMSFAERLQVGWLELDDLNLGNLRAQFEDQSVYSNILRIPAERRDYLDRLPVAMDLLQDRTDPEFGPAIAQLIKLVRGFFEKNADEIAKYDSSFNQEKYFAGALQVFVEKMVFRLAYFAQVEDGMDNWDKRRSFQNALDKLGDVDIPEYFSGLYGRSVRLTAQVDLLSHQIRELAFTLFDLPKNEGKEAAKSKSLEQRVVKNGIRDLKVDDLLPLYAGGVEIGRLPDRGKYLGQVEGRLQNWQHPESSPRMFESGLMTQENADKFNALVKEILNRLLNFYRRNENKLKKVDGRFVSPQDQLKRALQYIFYYHYRIYAPGATDSSSSEIISHFEDAISKVAEGLRSTPLGEIEQKIRELRRQLAAASRLEKITLQREVEELENLARDTRNLQEYLYKVTSRAYPFTARVEEVA